MISLLAGPTLCSSLAQSAETLVLFRHATRREILEQNLARMNRRHLRGTGDLMFVFRFQFVFAYPLAARRECVLAGLEKPHGLGMFNSLQIYRRDAAE